MEHWANEIYSCVILALTFVYYFCRKKDWVVSNIEASCCFLVFTVVIFMCNAQVIACLLKEFGFFIPDIFGKGRRRGKGIWMHEPRKAWYRLAVQAGSSRSLWLAGLQGQGGNNSSRRGQLSTVPHHFLLSMMEAANLAISKATNFYLSII